MMNTTILESVGDIKKDAGVLRKRWQQFKPQVIKFTQAVDKALEDHRPRKMLGDKIVDIEEIAMCQQTLSQAGLSQETRLMSRFHDLLQRSLELRRKSYKLMEILQVNIEDRHKEERIRCLRIIHRGLLEWKDCAPKMPFRLHVHADIKDRLTLRAKGQCGLLISLVPSSLDNCQQFLQYVELGWMSKDTSNVEYLQPLSIRESQRSTSSDRSFCSFVESQTDRLSTISSPTPTERRTTVSQRNSLSTSFDSEDYRDNCLEEYRKQITMLECSWTRKDVNFTSSIFVAGVLDREGGTLTIPETQVAMTLPRIPSSGHFGDEIPVGGFDIGDVVLDPDINDEFQANIYVDPDCCSSIRPPLSAKQTFVSPLIRCGPLGKQLNRPAILTIPHCVREVDKWFFQAYYRDDGCISENWENVADEKDMHFLVGDKNCLLLINRLVDVQIVGEVTHVMETPKLLRVGVFSVPGDISCDVFHIRLHIWNNTDADTQAVEVVEKGTRLCEDVVLEVYPRGGDIMLTVDKMSPSGWSIDKFHQTQAIGCQQMWGSSKVAVSKSYKFEYYGRELTPSVFIQIGIKQKHPISKRAVMNIQRATDNIAETTNDVIVTYGHKNHFHSESPRTRPMTSEVNLVALAKADQLLHPDIHSRVCSNLTTSRKCHENGNASFTEKGRRCTSASSNISSACSYQIGQPRVRRSAPRTSELLDGRPATAVHQKAPIPGNRNSNLPKDYRGLALTQGLSPRTIHWIGKQNYPESAMLEYFHVIHTANDRTRLQILDSLHRVGEEIGNKSMNVLVEESIHRILLDKEDEQSTEKPCVIEEIEEVERRRNSLRQKSEHLKLRVRRESIHLEDEEVQEDFNRSVILLDDGLRRGSQWTHKLQSVEKKVHDLEEKLDDEVSKCTVSMNESIQKRLSKLQHTVNHVFAQDGDPRQKYLTEIARLQEELFSSKETIDIVARRTKDVAQLEQTIESEADIYLKTLEMSIRQQINLFKESMKTETTYCPDVAEPFRNSLQNIEYELPAAKTSSKELVRLQSILEETETHFRERIVWKSKSLFEEIMDKLRFISKHVDDMSFDSDVQTLRATVTRLQQEANESFGFLVRLQELLWQVDQLKLNVTDMVNEKLTTIKTTLHIQAKTLGKMVDEDVGDTDTTGNLQKTLTTVGKECQVRRTSLTRLRKMSSDVSFLEKDVDEIRKVEMKLNDKLQSKLEQLLKQLPTLASYEDVQKFKLELTKLEEEKTKHKPSTAELKGYYQKAVDIERRLKSRAEINHTKHALLLRLRHLEKSMKIVYPKHLAEELLDKITRIRKKIIECDKTLSKTKRLGDDLDKLELKVKGFLNKCAPVHVEYNLLDQIAEIVQPIWTPIDSLDDPEMKHAALIKEAGLRGNANSMLKEGYKRRNGKLKWESLLRVVRQLDNQGDIQMRLKEIRALSGNGMI